MPACLTLHFSCCCALVFTFLAVFNENLIYLLTLGPLLAAFMFNLGPPKRGFFTLLCWLLAASLSTEAVCGRLQRLCISSKLCGFSLYVPRRIPLFLKALTVRFYTHWFVIQPHWHPCDVCNYWGLANKTQSSANARSSISCPFRNHLNSLFKTRIVGCQRDYIVQSSDTQTDEVHALQDLSSGKNSWWALVTVFVTATVMKSSLDHCGFSTALSIFVESTSEQLYVLAPQVRCCSLNWLFKEL